MRGGFRGGRFGDTSGAALPNPQAGVPGAAGGNATQGKGIVFTYSTPLYATLNHGASSGSQIIQFDNNSTFQWLRSFFTCDVSAAQFTESSQPIPLITVQITDTGNGMSFMNAPIPVYAVAGIFPGLPFILPTPQWIQPNASYALNFTNYDAAVNYTNLRFELIGVRYFNV
jgi:hypothetical protein